MNTCKFCGESSPNMINDICIDCLADKLGDIVEMTPILSRKIPDRVIL